MGFIVKYYDFDMYFAIRYRYTKLILIATHAKPERKVMTFNRIFTINRKSDITQMRYFRAVPPIDACPKTCIAEHYLRRSVGESKATI